MKIKYIRKGAIFYRCPRNDAIPYEDGLSYCQLELCNAWETCQIYEKMLDDKIEQLREQRTANRIVKRLDDLLKDKYQDWL